MMLGGGPLGEERLLTVHTLWRVYGESSKSLEGDHGRDRVRLCHLLMSVQEGLEGDRGRDRVQQCRLFNVISRTSTPEIVLSRIFFQNSASMMANCIIIDTVNYLMLLLANS